MEKINTEKEQNQHRKSNNISTEKEQNHHRKSNNISTEKEQNHHRKNQHRKSNNICTVSDIYSIRTLLQEYQQNHQYSGIPLSGSCYKNISETISTVEYPCQHPVIRISAKPSVQWYDTIMLSAHVLSNTVNLHHMHTAVSTILQTSGADTDNYLPDPEPAFQNLLLRI